jgi:TPR repeat protein
LGSLAFNHEKDFKTAVKYFKVAAENGICARAINNLGICFEMGQEEYNLAHKVDLKDDQPILKDIDHAADLYLQSAQMDFSPSMVNLAYLIFKSAKNSVKLKYGNKYQVD